MITPEQATLIREMAMAEKPNAEIIKATRLPAAEVYAYRSQHGITRDKVKAILAGQDKATILEKHIGKPEFVQYYLAPLLKAIDANITKVEYISKDDKETVHIEWGEISYHRIINVTADSLRALSRDVLRVMN